jgi:hypothetical protein
MVGEFKCCLRKYVLAFFFRGCKQSNFSTRLSGKGRNFTDSFIKKAYVL